MSQYIIIDHIKVQNANAIAGFTWGFPAITHFLGFVHNLSRKLSNHHTLSDISLSGCAVIAHEHHVHTFGKYEKRFTQSRNPAYLKKDAANLDNSGKTPPIIEEGKMNMTVSLVIHYTGVIGNREDGFKKWLETNCYTQRLAGGTILKIKNIGLHTFDNEKALKGTMRRLLPGFVLMDRSSYLKEHYEALESESPDVELFDAWLDFSALKRKARPKSNLITAHLQELCRENQEHDTFYQILADWENHLSIPYAQGELPQSAADYLNSLEENKQNKKLIEQWQSYCEPNEKSEADWEYIPKPKPGYLVPIMTGYKAISPVYKNEEVANTRDNETDACFVESVHSVGEWLSAHRIKSIERLKESIWNYVYEENWYLCKQEALQSDDGAEERHDDDDDDDDDIYS